MLRAPKDDEEIAALARILMTSFSNAMRAAGLLDGDAAALSMLFSGPEPWCCDRF